MYIMGGRASKKVQTAETRADIVRIREFGKGKTKNLRTPTVPFRISAEEEVQNESRRRRRRRNCWRRTITDSSVRRKIIILEPRASPPPPLIIRAAMATAKPARKEMTAIALRSLCLCVCLSLSRTTTSVMLVLVYLHQRGLKWLIKKLVFIEPFEF